MPKGCSLLSLYDKLQTAFEEFQSWQMRMNDACAFGCNLQELINLSECMTPNHIYIADMSFKILAYTDKKIMEEISATWRCQLAHSYLPVQVMKGMIETKEFEQLNGFHMAKHFFSQNFYVPFAAKNIFYNNRPQAHLFIVNVMKRPCFRDLAVAQLLGEFIEKYFFVLDEFKLNRNVNNHEAFFCDILRGNCTNASIISRQISLFDWQINDSYCIAVIPLGSRDECFRKIILYQLTKNSDFKCCIFDNNLIVIINQPQDKQDSLRIQLKRLASHYSLEICQGQPYPNFLNTKSQYQLLIRIIEIVHRYYGVPFYYEASDYSLLYIIDRILSDPKLNRLCSWDAKLLQKYDLENGTDYFLTYSTYLANDRNVVHTSRLLHIHRNTLMYRLDKIHDLISTDEEKPEQKLHLLFSMLLLKHQDIFKSSRPE